MKISETGLEFIRLAEALYLKAYKCPAGVLTIGYGHTSAAGDPIVREGDEISASEAERILRWDMNSVSEEVNRLVWVKLTQNQFDALCSWTFNLGADNLAESTMLKRLNAGESGERITEQLKRWNKCNGKPLAGLTKRRNAEAELFLGNLEKALTMIQA